MTEPTEQRDTTTIAGKFAEALGCIEDAACWLERINKRYAVLYPNDTCAEPELEFWWGVSGMAMALTVMMQDLKAVEPLAPKEVTA